MAATSFSFNLHPTLEELLAESCAGRHNALPHDSLLSSHRLLETAQKRHETSMLSSSCAGRVKAGRVLKTFHVDDNLQWCRPLELVVKVSISSLTVSVLEAQVGNVVDQR